MIRKKWGGKKIINKTIKQKVNKSELTFRKNK